MFSQNTLLKTLLREAKKQEKKNIVVLEIFLKKSLCHAIQGFSGKTPRGVGVFLHHFQLRLAGKKTPPPFPSFVKNKEKQGFLNKKSVGWGFFPLFSVEVSREKKTPPEGFSGKPL